MTAAMSFSVPSAARPAHASLRISPSLSFTNSRSLGVAVVQLNTLVKQLCRTSPRLIYIEAYDLVLGPDGRPRPELFLDDKLHLNAAGYELLADRVRPFLPR